MAAVVLRGEEAAEELEQQLEKANTGDMAKANKIKKLEQELEHVKQGDTAKADKIKELEQELKQAIDDLRKCRKSMQQEEDALKQRVGDRNTSAVRARLSAWRDAVCIYRACREVHLRAFTLEDAVARKQS